MDQRVRLRDGSEVVIRPVTGADKPLFTEGFEHLSESSRYKRFMAFKKALSEKELAYFTELDHVNHEALGALEATTGAGLGVARYIRERQDPDVAEAAVVVVDDWHGRGLGTELLRRLAARAQVNGVHHFSAVLFTGNTAMRHVFEALGETQVRSRGPGDTMTLDIRLPVADGQVLQRALGAAARGDVAGTPD